MNEFQDKVMQVLDRDHVTFAELSYVEGFEGPLEVHLNGCKNLILRASGE
jgi:hypothetical protein